MVVVDTRTDTGGDVAKVNWLIKGSASERWIVTAPGTPTGVAEAVEQLDAALDGFSGKVPGWFRAVRKTGSWWYLICVAIAVVVVVAVAPAEIGMRIAVGITVGILLAVLSGPLLRLLATAQSPEQASAHQARMERYQAQLGDQDKR